MGSFQLHGATVARVNDGADLATVLAPRPYLHPLRTLAGVPLTEAGPDDHPHHLGLSLAFSDVNGSNFWGGSTYTGHGPALLANHGRQVPSGWSYQTRKGGAGLSPGSTQDGQELASEQRSYTYQEHPDSNSWSLSFDSLIRPAGDVEQLSVSSSAVKGRRGAGYGGIFWRFPAGDGPAERAVFRRAPERRRRTAPSPRGSWWDHPAAGQRRQRRTRARPRRNSVLGSSAQRGTSAQGPPSRGTSQPRRTGTSPSSSASTPSSTTAT